MFVAYHPDYVVDIGDGHRFPMQKYGLVYERLMAEGTIGAEQVVTPEPASVASLLLVHHRDYVERFLAGEMTPREMRVLGLPWSEALARRARLAVQGTLIASRLALRHGLAANLAGGSHHAFADHGEGFSVFHDMAVAARALQRDHGLQRAAMIDCDVHQGNGSAVIFQHDPRVYTCSFHGEKNYPFRKAQSRLDIALPDGTDDGAYLAALRAHVPRVLREARPRIGVVSGRRRSVRRRQTRPLEPELRGVASTRSVRAGNLPRRPYPGGGDDGRRLRALHRGYRRGALQYDPRGVRAGG